MTDPKYESIDVETRSLSQPPERDFFADPRDFGDAPQALVDDFATAGEAIGWAKMSEAIEE